LRSEAQLTAGLWQKKRSRLERVRQLCREQKINTLMKINVPRSFFAISVSFFALSHFDAISSIGYGVVRPLGAVFFILFFITYVLRNEVALYNEQCREAASHENETRPSPAHPEYVKAQTALSH
jgi:hypothetical protein